MRPAGEVGAECAATALRDGHMSELRAIIEADRAAQVAEVIKFAEMWSEFVDDPDPDALADAIRARFGKR